MRLWKRQHHWGPTSPPRDEDFAREINPRRELETTESEQQDSTIAISITALVGAAAIAGYLRARRASRIDSMIALR
jgi:hypothetical protein